ncbi:PREDICTED: DNA-directed RNA polymerase III subunit RPC9 isoform X2 [Myotis brandtii]|uniref:DNA-directed RNA polymerase III subunit RPC9 isoform X2 n=1 Tax=Myotis brandtii TaxID=109478 RepID=UPI000703F7F5|nr:PREDICTED: DNA-directed RNA polymerase III subunit RPC9 isoform X2 [Myotis brandtii]
MVAAHNRKKWLLVKPLAFRNFLFQFGLVFQLLTDLKEQRKESGKNKHSTGQQNLNTITYETLKYISKTPCSHQSPEIVREFLTAMKSHKLTKKSCRVQCKGLLCEVVFFKLRVNVWGIMRNRTGLQLQ